MNTVPRRRRSTAIFVFAALPLLVLCGTRELHAALLIYNAATPSGNATTRSDWLAAAGVVAPAYSVDFESGFTDGQNVTGITGLFPAGLVIGSGDNSAIVRSGTGAINNSNPVGEFALTHTDTNAAALVLDFSVFPLDYVAFQDIDAVATSITVTFVGGGTVAFALDTTGSSGDSAEFAGLFRNDMPRISRLELVASGGGVWGVDNIEYGPIVPIPSTIFLLGTGLLGLIGRCRRRKSTNLTLRTS